MVVQRFWNDATDFIRQQIACPVKWRLESLTEADHLPGGVEGSSQQSEPYADTLGLA